MNAHIVLDKPAVDAPPDADAPFDTRESWCDARVARLIATTPALPVAGDIRPTHLFETEMSSCKLDPQQYERQLRYEATR